MSQLVGTASPVLVHGATSSTPLLHAAAELLPAPAPRYNAHFFKHLVVALRPVAVRLEERSRSPFRSLSAFSRR